MAGARVTYDNQLTSSSYIHAGPGRTVLADVLYHMRLYDGAGVCKWDDMFSGLVVNVGLTKLMDACFKTGYAAPDWYVGLLDGSGTIAINATDTMSGHPGWTENTDYSQAGRPALTLGAITNGVVDNIASLATFTITADGNLGGALVVNASTKGVAAGTLYDAGQFIDGVRPVKTNDTLEVSVTLSVSAA